MGEGFLPLARTSSAKRAWHARCSRCRGVSRAIRSERRVPSEVLLRHAVSRAAQVLPAQGPIGSFIHHNTLHAFQHLPFHAALAAAHELHDAETYLPEGRYRDEWREGRIDDVDVEHALAMRRREVPDRAVGPLSVGEIERLVLRFGVTMETPEGLRWRQDELEETRRLRADLPSQARARIIERTGAWLAALSPDEAASMDALLAPAETVASLRRELAARPESAAARALWAACLSLAPARGDAERAAMLERYGVDRTHRDLLVALGAPDPAEAANAVLVDFLGAYLDDGMARWAMPGRDRGLLACFSAHLGAAPLALPPWLRAVRGRLARASAEGEDDRSIAIAIAILEELGVAPTSWERYLPRLLLELPGWTGMVARLESSPGDRGPGAPPVSLMELTAIRLVLDVESMRVSADAIGHRAPLAQLVETARRSWAAHAEPRSAHDAPHRLFQIHELAAHAAPDVIAHGASVAREIVDVLDAFDGVARRRTLHEAYEHHFLRDVFRALRANRERPAHPEAMRPRFQAMFCFDDREESLRRHFEELDGRHVTYGVAGFYGVAMQYRGLDSGSAVPLCPAVVTPAHAVREEAVEAHAPRSERRRRIRASAGWLRHELADGSRSLLRGAALTPVLGLLAAIPLAARVLFPRATARLSLALSTWLLPAPRTVLTLRRATDADPPSAEALHDGFTLDERVGRVAATLENVGLTSRFAPIVVTLGHGASTVNNPHHSAYDCGACGGKNGGPSARAFASMANDPEVRIGLRARGIRIPERTWFVGGFHDTTTDAVVLYDVEQVPEGLRAELDALRDAFDRARALTAHERCRKFEHAAGVHDVRAALAHVEERAVDLSQARPELGHATIAWCFVGRRALTRGLFLDRRVFLVSYDPAVDDDGAILERILAAAVPVGAGIALEYFFSTVDDERWGCGTKLPHNLAGLLGVMEGASGDLRTGLPRQMTEIHEPQRLLCVIEADPSVVIAIAERQPEVAELVRNGWVRLACFASDTGVIEVFDTERFRPWTPEDGELPVVRRAREWYEGNAGLLAPARIELARTDAA